MVQVGKKWYRCGEICEIGPGSGEYEVVVQAEDWFSRAVGGYGQMRCRMGDERCVMYDSGVGEDVAYLLVGCGKFERDRQVLLDDMCRIMWARE